MVIGRARFVGLKMCITVHCFLAFSKEHCSPLCTLFSFFEFICNICLTSSIVQLVLFYSSNSFYIKDKQVVSMFSIFCMILFSSIESIVKMYNLVSNSVGLSINKQFKIKLFTLPAHIRL